MTSDFGFAGLTASGTDPQTAYDVIRERCSQPAVRAVLDEMRRTPQGRAALDTSRQRWADLGFSPPWEDSSDPGPSYQAGRAALSPAERDAMIEHETGSEHERLADGDV